METIRNVNQLFVQKDQAATAGLESATIETIADLKNGEVVLTDVKNAGLDGSTTITANAFKLIQRAGSSLIHSDVVEQGKVKACYITTQSVEVQQVDYVGSNGTAGALDEIASNIYTVRLYVQGSTIADFMQQKIKEGFYKSNTAAASYTQEAVATGLYDSLIANFSRESEEEIRFGRVLSGARTIPGTGTDTFTWTQGSKTVAVVDVDDATVTAALAVGEWIGPALAVTTPLYKIVSIDTTGNTLQLDKPFKEASTTSLDDATSRCTVAQALAGDYGVKLTGIDRGFKTGFFKSAVVQWKTTIDFGDNQTTTVDESVAAYPGDGTYQQLASLEKEFQADNHVYRSHVESGVVDNVLVDTTTDLYDVVVIEYWGSIESGLGVDVKSPKMITIALENNTAGGDDANSGVVTILNQLFGTDWAVPGFASMTPTA